MKYEYAISNIGDIRLILKLRDQKKFLKLSVIGKSRFEII